jgi:hypothetical protein
MRISGRSPPVRTAVVRRIVVDGAIVGGPPVRSKASDSGYANPQRKCTRLPNYVISSDARRRMPCHLTDDVAGVFGGCSFDNRGMQQASAS